MKPLLAIKDLSIRFQPQSQAVVSIQSLSIEKGKTLALVGESGSGKSVTALSILKLLDSKATVEGEVLFATGSSPVNLIELSNSSIREFRGKKIAMIFQEPMTSLNPVLTCGAQVEEAILAHENISRREARARVSNLFEQVGLAGSSGILKRYPHQLSGGQKQRVMIAMAISCDPDLLIADEPTTALDVRVQQGILSLLRKIQLERNLAILLITHDLGIVADIADSVAVMYKGSIVEQGDTGTLLHHPEHPYSKALLACRPGSGAKGKKLFVVSDFIATEGNAGTRPMEVITVPDGNGEVRNLLEVQNLSVIYRSKTSLFTKAPPGFKAVDDVSFVVRENETLGLVGESGSGKSTLARAILQLEKPTSGRILLNGTDLSNFKASELKERRKDLQIIFQDPYGSLNPRLTIGKAIMEPLKVHGLYNNDNQRKERIISLLEQVQLQADHFSRFPHQFSGGQRQRICIARALALEPNFLVFDESLSALDVSVQAQILNLLNDLKSQHNFTSLFISHDLAVVHYISDRIMVMRAGKIVETGTAGQVFNTPVHEYTKQLIDAIPGKTIRN